MPVDVGVVGAGGRSGVHCESLAALGDANLAAVCDIDEQRAAAAAEEFGFDEVFHDYAAMLGAVDLDAVYVLTLPYQMEPIVTDCLEAGLDVFTEKPPGVSAEQTREWAALADRRDCRTAVGFQRRFHPLSVEAKARVEQRSDVRYGVGTFHKHEPGGVELFDGVYNALMLDVVHVVDLLVWMGGGVRETHGFYGQVFGDAERFDPLYANVYAAVLEFDGGGIGLLNSNRMAGGRDLEFEMHGRGVSAYAGIHGDPALDELVVQRDDQPYGEADRVGTRDVVDDLSPGPRADGTFQLNRHFLECVEADAESRVSFADTVETMAVVEEILQGRRFPPTLDGG